MKKYLFVGGDCDGHRIEVADGLPEVRMVAAASGSASREFTAATDVVFTTQSYRRIELADGAAHYVIYMHENVAQPIRMLIEGYGRSK